MGEETLLERRAKAQAIIDNVGKRAEEALALPATGREAVRMVAAQNLSQKILVNLQSDPAAAMTDEQRMAAMLIGQGSTHDETAQIMAVPVGQIYRWTETVPGFMEELMKWRQHIEIDLGGTAIVQLREMAARPDLEDSLRVKVIALLLKIGRRPEERYFQRANLGLNAEKLELQRQHLRMKAGQAQEESAIVRGALTRFGKQLLEEGAQADREAAEGEFDVEDEEADVEIDVDEEAGDGGDYGDFEDDGGAGDDEGDGE